MMEYKVEKEYCLIVDNLEFRKGDMAEIYYDEKDNEYKVRIEMIIEVSKYYLIIVGGEKIYFNDISEIKKF